MAMQKSSGFDHLIYHYHFTGLLTALWKMYLGEHFPSFRKKPSCTPLNSEEYHLSFCMLATWIARLSIPLVNPKLFLNTMESFLLHSYYAYETLNYEAWFREGALDDHLVQILVC